MSEFKNVACGPDNTVPRFTAGVMVNAHLNTYTRACNPTKKPADRIIQRLRSAQDMMKSSEAVLDKKLKNEVEDKNENVSLLREAANMRVENESLRLENDSLKLEIEEREQIRTNSLLKIEKQPLKFHSDPELRIAMHRDQLTLKLREFEEEKRKMNQNIQDKESAEMQAQRQLSCALIDLQKLKQRNSVLEDAELRLQTLLQESQQMMTKSVSESTQARNEMNILRQKSTDLENSLIQTRLELDSFKKNLKESEFNHEKQNLSLKNMETELRQSQVQHKHVELQNIDLKSKLEHTNSIILELENYKKKFFDLTKENQNTKTMEETYKQKVEVLLTTTKQLKDSHELVQKQLKDSVLELNETKKNYETVLRDNKELCQKLSLEESRANDYSFELKNLKKTKLDQNNSFDVKLQSNLEQIQNLKQKLVQNMEQSNQQKILNQELKKDVEKSILKIKKLKDKKTMLQTTVAELNHSLLERQKELNKPTRLAPLVNHCRRLIAEFDSNLKLDSDNDILCGLAKVLNAVKSGCVSEKTKGLLREIQSYKLIDSFCVKNLNYASTDVLISDLAQVLLKKYKEVVLDIQKRTQAEFEETKKQRDDLLLRNEDIMAQLDSYAVDFRTLKRHSLSPY